MPVVHIERPAPGVLQLRLDRSEAMNAMTHQLVTELHSGLDQADRDDECRVVILTGTGRAFCAGLDLNDYGDETVKRMGAQRGGLSRQREIASLAEKIRGLRQPVIAAVNGAAAGGGLALVLASDIRIAADSAVFAVGFIRAGFSACDIGLSWLLPRIVGAGAAHELMLTGRKFDSAEALRIGLLFASVPAESLMDVVYAKAAEIQLNPPFSVELTKQGMWIALETPSFHASVEFENRQQILTAQTEDRTEARDAFLEKRAPQYKYR